MTAFPGAMSLPEAGVAVPLPRFSSELCPAEAGIDVTWVRPSEALQSQAEVQTAEDPHGRLYKAGRFIARVGAAAAAGLGFSAAPEAADAQYDALVVRLAERTATGVKKWAAIGSGKDGTPKLAPLKRAWEMTKSTTRTLLPTANLALGEAAAIAPQAALQAAEMPTSVSLGAFIAASLAVEVACSWPIAKHNQKAHPHIGETMPQKLKRVSTAMAEGFWLGGAWGVKSGELNKKEQWAAIGSYMLYGGVLGVLGEWNNLSEKVVESPWFLPALGYLAFSRTVNNALGHEGYIDRAATWSANTVSKGLARLGLVPSEPTLAR